MIDKVIRIAVGVLAVLGVAFAFAGPNHVTSGIWLAVLSLVAALALNIVPVGDREKFHGELFRLWSDLRKDADREEYKTCELEESQKATGPYSERLSELYGKKDSLNSIQSAPWKGLLKRCQKESYEELGIDPCPQATSPSPPGVSAASAAGAVV